MLDFYRTLKNLLELMDIQVLHTKPPFIELENFDYGLRKSLDPFFNWQDLGQILQDHIPANTMMLTQDCFGINYILFRLSSEDTGFYIVGPWAHSEDTNNHMNSLIKQVSEDSRQAVIEYFNEIRTIPANEDNAMTIVYSLLNSIDPEHPFTAKKYEEYLPMNFRPDSKMFDQPAFQKNVPYQIIEDRYNVETKLMEAVMRGDLDQAFSCYAMFKRYKFHGRFVGSLYAIKSKMIIFNTLMRKSIQAAKVHPFYIDRISEKYSKQIEFMSEDDEEPMLSSMLREYCDYVKKYSVINYSPMIQNTINYVNLNLDGDLTLKNLSSLSFISPSYLSNLFKQETGETLSGYISSRRVYWAQYYLRTTDLSIAAIAARVGVLDVNYFSKIFRKATDETPSQYRSRELSSKHTKPSADV